MSVSVICSPYVIADYNKFGYGGLVATFWEIAACTVDLVLSLPYWFWQQAVLVPGHCLRCTSFVYSRQSI